jgi:uncharacterized protein
MLIRFAVKNFKTFREKAELSLVASNYDKNREAENISDNSDFGLRVLKSAVIYGANASGKSKLMEAFVFMRNLVLTSSKESQKGDPIYVEPFKLSTASENEPSEFEVIFIYLNEQFRYGFEVNNKEVISEWLFHKPNTKEVELFYREGQDFKIHPRNFPKGKLLIKENFVRENALMLSAAAQWNDDKAGNVLEWFNSLKIISGLNEDGYAGFTISQTTDPLHKQKQLEFLQKADLDIHDITIKREKADLSHLPGDVHKTILEMIEQKHKEEFGEPISDVLTAHKKYNADKKYVGNVNLSMATDESSGTRKFFFLSGPILNVINNGYILVVDELDAKLHPNLVCKIVEIFNSKELNPKNAQLIFNTHDTNLLSSGNFRRDQIWFTEKNRYGEASLYSLADFKSNEVRKEDNFEKNYVQGKYGAIPFLGDFKQLFTTNPVLSHENEEQETGAN